MQFVLDAVPLFILGAAFGLSVGARIWPWAIVSATVAALYLAAKARLVAAKGAPRG